jgi:iron complex transport system ATP-binding protein
MTLVCENVNLQVNQAKLLIDLSVEIEGGTLTAVIGPNGAGKSSLLKILSGELVPSSGEVFLNSLDMRELTLKEMSKARSVMTQSSNIVFDFTVKEVVLFGWLDHGAVCWDTFDAVILSSGVRDLIPRKYNSLSGGEKQRVQFARALLQLHSNGNELAGKYMLLDEPTSSLDIAHSLQLLSLTKQTTAHGLGSVVVLHDLNLAARFADNVILMHRGRIVRLGKVEHVFDDDALSEVYATKIVAERHEVLDRLVIYA